MTYHHIRLNLYFACIILTTMIVAFAVEAEEKCGNLCDENWWQTATLDLIKSELSAGADVMAKDSYQNLTPLHFAAMEGTPEAIQVLLEAGAEVMVLGADKSTPLHLAKTKENMQILLAYGARVDAKDVSGTTTLMYSSMSDQFEAAKLLIKHGADPSSKNIVENTPLHVAKTGRMVNLLVSAGADVTARNDGGKTPLHFIAGWQSEENGAIQALLEAGVDPKIKDYNGRTALDYIKENTFLLNSAGYQALEKLGAPQNNYNKGLTAAQAGDFVTALKEWRPLAEQGDARSQYALGAMYEYGSGVLQDNITAHMWYNISWDNGFEKAGEWRDETAAKMTSADISKAQKMARECMSSNYQNCGW